MICPFCGEADFDKIGLKLHFENGHCDVYEEIGLRRGPFGLEAQVEDTEPRCQCNQHSEDMHICGSCCR